MKIRNGFVSNSSSSSFVLLLPENFIEGVDYDKIVQDYSEEFPVEKFKELLTRFVADGGMWDEDIYDYDPDDWEFHNILYELMQPYVLASMDSGPDSGQWTVIDKDKVMNILKNVTNEN